MSGMETPFFERSCSGLGWRTGLHGCEGSMFRESWMMLASETLMFGFTWMMFASETPMFG